jgi:quercetin dioxygenase-like cupin family protein
MAQVQTGHKAITVVNLLETAEFDTGKARKDGLLSLSGVNFIQLAIKAGDELPSHHVNKAAFALLVHGKAKFPISGETYRIKTGAFLEIPKDAEHAITAEEDSVFLLGIIGSPAEEDAC